MISYIIKLFTETNCSRRAALLTALMFAGVTSALAEGPAKSSMTNPLVIIMVAFMVSLLVVIAVLANMLISTARLKFKKWKDEDKKNVGVQAAVVIIGLLLLSSPVFAQTTDGSTTAATTQAATDLAAGVSSTTFYIMAGVIFFEMVVVLGLLLQVRGLLKAEKERALAAVAAQPGVAGKPAMAKKKGLNWWDRFNKFRPVEQEADIDLGHDYDGIRELDNRLPPWWLWGFYITIVFAGVYLYRYHVAHSAPLSAEEYQISVAKGDAEVAAYLKAKGDVVDENTVTMLGKDDIEAGHKLFETSCIACHMEGGAGNIGPNLTDDYWLHGGDIKSVFKTIRYGFNAMPSWQNTYSNKQIAELASYVKSLHGTHPANPKAPQGELYKGDDSGATSTATDSTAAKRDSAVVK